MKVKIHWKLIKLTSHGELGHYVKIHFWTVFMDQVKSEKSVVHERTFSKQFRFTFPHHDFLKKSNFLQINFLSRPFGNT